MTRLISPRLLLSLALSALAVWFVARQVHFDEVHEALSAVHGPLVLLAVAALCAGFACRIARWQLMLRVERPALSLRACAGPLLAGFCMNNVLPLRAGDLARTFGFNQRLGLGPGTVAASMLVERLLDLLMLLAALGLALMAFDVGLDRIAQVGSGALVTLAAVVLLCLMRPQLMALGCRLALALVKRLAPRLAERLRPEVERGLASLMTYGSAPLMARLLAWSVAAWSCEAAMFWLAAQSMPALITPTAAWLAFPIGTLSTLVPSSPGYVGTFDYFVSLAMGQMGNSTNAAVAYAVLVHLLVWLPPTLAGLAYLLAAPPVGWVFWKIKR
jgi:hypothetical protein